MRGVLRRGFWAAMLLLHLGPIAASFAALGALADVGTGWLRFGFLVGSGAFFLLKLADVRWLRVKPGWHTWVASLVVVGLLHASVLDRAAGTDAAFSPGHVCVVLFFTGLLGAEGAAGGLTRLWRFANLRSPVRPKVACCGRAVSDGLQLPAWLICGSTAAPRAPPAC